MESTSILIRRREFKIRNQIAPDCKSGAAVASTRSGFRKWLKRVGVGGFLFFLLKGIAWLVVGYFIAR